MAEGVDQHSPLSLPAGQTPRLAAFALSELGANVVVAQLERSSARLWTPIREQRLLLRTLRDGGTDQAARPSIAVAAAAAARRSTLPSGLRGTASTANSRSGTL